ncbi:response regulator [Sinanaerobacter chloroacetimidivorans]|uniref:Stage 0 sporulation protein A homolog n=1 Tax=Sinanaerobacter chloroacetimidivorans TaxID=2818044 RepID=A0A8J8B5G3_9FIRM|nr:response regulator [Sinanaerobacter chloroacetimidivorans]MBR0600310.1 response regulator [Sinanaerobacter chloroacetimidivorans]
MFKIIIIEDSSFMRARLTNLLQDNGYNQIDNFVSADDIGRKPHLYLNGVDLVLADIQLPGISGIDLLNILNKDPRYSKIPFIFISGYGDITTINKAVMAGAVDYIVKPFENTTLLEKVKRILGQPYQISKDYDYNDDKFTKIILMEYQRATRGNQPLSFLKLKVDNTNISFCISIIIKQIRVIDTICVFKNNIIVILPLTNDSGLVVVENKLKAQILENNMDILGINSFTYFNENELNNGDFINIILEFSK